MRSATVLVKKPSMPSNSGRLRPANQGTDQDVVLTGVAMQDGLKRCQEGHEQRDVVFLR